MTAVEVEGGERIVAEFYRDIVYTNYTKAEN